MNLIGTCLRIPEQYRAFRATLAGLQISRPVHTVAAARGSILASAC